MQTFINGDNVEGESTVGGVRTYVGPILDTNLLLVFAYYNLATQLRHSDVVEASITWFKKAIQTAESNQVEEDIISVLLAGLADAEKYLNSVNFDSRNIQAHDTIVGDRISNGIEGLDGEGEGVSISRGSSRKSTKSSVQSSRNQQLNGMKKGYNAA
jgi:hypothetical protein